MPKKKNNDPAPADMFTATMALFNPATSGAWSEVASEFTTMAARNWQIQLDAQSALMSCKTPMDVMQVQTGYCQQVLEAFAEQNTRMVDLMTSAASQTVAEAASGHRRKYNDIPV